MKLKNVILGVASVALASASASAAPTTVLHIAGSTAYRVSVTAAIIAELGNGSFGTGAVKAAYYSKSTTNGLNATASNLYKAQNAIFLSPDGTTAVETDWTGSLAGVTDLVTDNTTLTFLPDSTASLATTVTPLSGGSTGTGGTYGSVIGFTTNGGTTAITLQNHATDTVFSDSFASSVAASVATSGAISPAITGNGFTINNGTDLANAIAGEPDLTAAASGLGDAVGIVPFAWYTGKGTGDSVTSISQSAALSLFQNGASPVTQFTGNTANKNDFFYLIGRNEDSGTRIAALAESQDGFGTGIQSQFQLTFTGTSKTDSNGLNTGGSSATVSGGKVWPAIAPLFTEPGIDWNTAGHSGYIAGGDVANVLSAANTLSGSAITGHPTENTGNAYFIGYLGWSDGAGITNGTELKYNGVTPSATNIANGSYTFWTFEHEYYLTGGSEANTVTSAQQNVADGIASLIATQYAPTTANGVTATATDPATEDALDASIAGVNVAGLIFDFTNTLFTRTAEGAPLLPNY